MFKRPFLISVVKISFALLAFGGSVCAQGSYVCNGTCSPSPTSSTYTSGTIQARPAARNQRGVSGKLGTIVGPYTEDAPSTTIAGSTSYSYAVPILHLPGRNGLDVDLTLYYNSAIWTVDTVNNRISLNADRDFPTYGFRLGYGMIEGNAAGGTSSLTLTEPDGTKRELRYLSGTTYDSADGTYARYDSSTRTLTRKDGTKWLYQIVPNNSTFFVPYKIVDTNGNYISITYKDVTAGFNAQAIETITDTLNRAVIFYYDATTHMPTSIAAPAFGGQGYTTVAGFTWTQQTLNYNYSITVTDTPPSGTTTINALTQFAYPTGTFYRFFWGDWGVVNRIEQVTPMGNIRAYESYNFPTAATALSDAPTYTTKTVFDGVNTANWTYQTTKTGLLVSSMAVTDPSGTVRTTNLYTSGSQTGLVSSTTIQSGGSTLRTSLLTWTQDGASPLLTSVLNTNDIGQQSKVVYTYTTFGNVSQVQEYDYGLFLTRTTQTDYLATSPYISLRILDRPTQVRIYNGSGTLVSRTDFAYDSSALTTVTGALNHDDTYYGSGFTTRGNLTTVTRYPNLPSTTPTIVRTSSYDTLGNLLSALVNCCNQEQWTFGSTTQYAYPSSIIRGPSGTQLTTSLSYDFNTGLVTSVTDPNSQQTSYTYDVMKRTTGITRPLGANTTFAFEDNAVLPAATTTGVIDGSNSLVSVTTTDGLGRVTKQETKSGAGTTYSIVEAQYDALGRATQVSNPHSPSESAVWTVNTYDALSRPITSTPPGSAGSYQYTYSGNATTVTDPAGKQRRTYTDAFGRISQVHEPGYDDGSYGSVSISIQGAEQSIQTSDNCPPHCTYFYDSGTVWITVNGYTATVSYSRYSTGTTLATALANAFNSASSPVTASSSGATVTLQAKLMGPQGNYAFTAGSSTNDPTDFGGPSFWPSPDAGNLTGGADGTGANQHPPTLNTPLVTVYSYDPLNNLKQVIQGIQNRTFVYDSLGRVKTATTPESGIVNYTYTDFSAVATRTDARSVVTNYQYDGLNRLVGLSYTIPQGSAVSAMPNNCTSAIGQPANVCFTFGTNAAANNNGRLASVTDGTGSESYTYDVLGRATALAKTVNGTNYPVAYQYNLAGELTSVTYPSTRVVQQTFDPIGRLSQIQSGGASYLTVATYNSASQPTAVTYGNGVQGSFGYNSRQQLASLAYSNTGGTLFSLAYNYGSGNNGQIQSITDNVDATRTTTYTYDAWARLKTGANSQWNLNWDYDRFGNRKNQNGTNMMQTAVDQATNRTTMIGTTSTSHDTAGNMTKDDLQRYVFDGENRQTKIRNLADTADVATYTYDGNGLRVQKQVVGGATTVYIFSGSKVIAEYDNGAAVTAPTREYIYSGSQLLAKIEGGATKYYHPDQLSNRVVTDSSGTVVGQSGHKPFGDNWYETGGTNKLKFTSYERDPEGSAANDYAMFRYDMNRLGRFSSPDPLSGSIADPQSLNGYAYTRNDPVNLVDPLGLQSESSPGIGAGCWAGLWLPLGHGTNIVWSFLPIINVPCSFGGSRLGEEKPTRFEQKEEERREKNKTVEGLRNALVAALLDDPDCLSFLGTKGAAVLSLLKTIPIGSTFILDAGVAAITETTYAPGNQVPTGASVSINDNGFFFLRGGVASVGGKTILTGTPRFQASTLLHELGHATGVLPQDVDSGVNKRNSEAIAEHCAKTISKFSKK